LWISTIQHRSSVATSVSGSNLEIMSGYVLAETERERASWILRLRCELGPGLREQ
jgi:hypothetical protein